MDKHTHCSHPQCQIEETVKENKRSNIDVLKTIVQICTILITSVCLPLIAWTLLSMVSLKVELSTERAVRETESKNLDKLVNEYKIDVMKLFTASDIENAQRHNEIMSNFEKQLAAARLDWEKRIIDYKAETDRRFQEIQKQLEQANSKLDKALDMLYLTKIPKTASL